ncbi:hypothetical protein [Halorussus sp. AFM4]|uniref:hypothetical protein n=1 Tax=Halorussus sp. AFM4 TaxID=3421651 RepID=UPI003EB86466
MNENESNTTEAQNAEENRANDIEFELQRPEHVYDHETGEEYLELVEDATNIEAIADSEDVRAEDVRRIIYTTGATLSHGIQSDVDVRYRGDGYAVTAAESNLDVVQEQINHEITDEHAIRAERELAPVDDEELPGEDELIGHYTEYLRYAVISAMDALNKGDSRYPVGYPLLVLTDE